MRIDGQSEAHTGPSRHDADDGTRLPFWWQHHRPHPGWCWIEHGDADGDGDRVCLSSSRELRPSLPDAAHTHDDESGGNRIERRRRPQRVPHTGLPRIRPTSALRRWQLKLDELITKRYTLDQINEGYQDLRDGKIIRGLVVFP